MKSKNALIAILSIAVIGFLARRYVSSPSDPLTATETDETET